MQTLILYDLQTHTMTKYCVIAAVGQSSLHRKWIDETSEFDLHLIVYDNSFDRFKNDTPFVTQMKGFKFRLIHEYFAMNTHLIDQYKYFYMPDDDIVIDSFNIHKLFAYMEKYKLAIAQPALSDSYFSYVHTIRRPETKIHFTNFIEMMQPCFSRKALKKVKFTFIENQSGWGMDFHWGVLLNYRKMTMAIIDDVISVHTKPVQSNFIQDLKAYCTKYNLSMEILST